MPAKRKMAAVVPETEHTELLRLRKKLQEYTNQAWTLVNLVETAGGLLRTEDLPDGSYEQTSFSYKLVSPVDEQKLIYAYQCACAMLGKEPNVFVLTRVKGWRLDRDKWRWPKLGRNGPEEE